MSQKNFFYPVKHAAAVFLEKFRRPGRFSVARYPRDKALERLRHKGLILDVGCGSRKLSDDVVAIDLTPGPCVKVVADANYLPFQSGAANGIWLEAVLEHVPDPAAVLREAWRVLRSDGWLYIEVPFLQGEHAAPGDYQRWTIPGLTQLLKEWDVEWIETGSGPFSALAYQLRSCLSMLTSFGSEFLYRMSFDLIWSYVVWPLKFLDFVVRRHPCARAQAFGYAVMARKKIS